MNRLRRANFFELSILVLGVIYVIVGYLMIMQVFNATGDAGPQLLITVFYWLIVAALIIYLSAAENMKEDLRIIIESQNEELRILRKSLKK